MATITRIDNKESFSTTFVFDDGESGSEINIPVTEADEYETKIKNASWSTLSTLFNLEGKTVIKSNE